MPSQSRAPAGGQPKSAETESQADTSPELLARNLLRAGLRTQELAAQSLRVMAGRGGPIDPLNISGAMMSLARAMGEDRQAVADAQRAWWRDMTLLWESTA